MIITLLLKNITTKKILQNSERISHGILLENCVNMLNNLVLLCVIMSVSVRFLSNYKPNISLNDIPSTKLIKAISIATS